MGRLAAYCKYIYEWEDINDQRQQGVSLRRESNKASNALDSSSSLPHVSPRFLWLPKGLSYVPGLSVRKTYSDQPQSSLLARLPKEVRLMIWGYVVGGQEVTVVRKMNKLSHALLPEDQWRLDAAKRQPMSKSILTLVHGFETRYKAGEVLSGVNLLPLLLTCRKVYLEALHVLYSENSFTFLTIEAFYRFLLVSSPVGLDALRTVTLKWRGFVYWAFFRKEETREPKHAFDESWREICDAVAALPCLASLTIPVLPWFNSSYTRLDPRPKDTELVREILLPLGGLSDRVEVTFEMNGGDISCTEKGGAATLASALRALEAPSRRRRRRRGMEYAYSDSN